MEYSVCPKAIPVMQLDISTLLTIPFKDRKRAGLQATDMSEAKGFPKTGRKADHRIGKKDERHDVSNIKAVQGI